MSQVWPKGGQSEMRQRHTLLAVLLRVCRRWQVCSTIRWRKKRRWGYLDGFHGADVVEGDAAVALALGVVDESADVDGLGRVADARAQNQRCVQTRRVHVQRLVDVVRQRRAVGAHHGHAFADRPRALLPADQTVQHRLDVSAEAPHPSRHVPAYKKKSHPPHRQRCTNFLSETDRSLRNESSSLCYVCIKFRHHRKPGKNQKKFNISSANVALSLI